MSQMTKILIGLIILLALALTVMTRINQSNVMEKIRLEENQAALLSKIKFYKTRDSLSAASVQRLTFSSHDLQQHRRELSQIIQNLDINVRRVQTASTTSVKSRNTIKTIIRDSIRILEAIPYTINKKSDTIRCLNYSDQ